MASPIEEAIARLEQALEAEGANALLEDAILQPPWRTLAFDLELHRDHLRLSVRIAEERTPTSPRTGEPCSGDRAAAEWELSTAAGGLWDYDEEARSRMRTTNLYGQRDTTLYRQRMGLGSQVRTRPRKPPPRRVRTTPAADGRCVGVGVE